MSAGPKPGSPEHTRIVTASKVAAIVGLSPWESPYSLWMKMKGRVVEEKRESPALARGNFLEQGVLDWWADRHPEFTGHVAQYYVTDEDLPWAGATLDALAWSSLNDGPSRQAVVEVKTASRMDGWGEPGTDLIPAHYLCQVYFQLALTPEAERAYVAVLGPYLEFFEYVVERDEAIQEALVDKCRTFYESLALDEPPELDGHTATLDTLKREHPSIATKAVATIPHDLAAEYVHAALDLDAATTRDRAAKAQVLNLAGDAQYIHDPTGTRIARRQPSKYGTSLVRVAKTYEPQEVLT